MSLCSVLQKIIKRGQREEKEERGGEEEGGRREEKEGGRREEEEGGGGRRKEKGRVAAVWQLEPKSQGLLTFPRQNFRQLPYNRSHDVPLLGPSRDVCIRGRL
jgi:hypothetical protein